MDNVCGNMLAEIGISINSPKQEVATLSGGGTPVNRHRACNALWREIAGSGRTHRGLSIKESHKVLDYVLQAKNRGLSVIFITHNIYHVYSVADRFTILEHGQKVAEIAKTDSTPEEIMEIIRLGINNFD